MDMEVELVNGDITYTAPEIFLTTSWYVVSRGNTIYYVSSKFTPWKKTQDFDIRASFVDLLL